MAEEAIEEALKDFYIRKGDDPAKVQKMKEEIKSAATGGN
jgi:hypothetical protein